jgi:Ca2+-binding RTX toxin-like protein
VDTVWTSLNSYTLGENVENVFFAGIGNFTAFGNQLDNVMVGGAGNDGLIGGAGADTLNGGAGNDIYEVTEVGDVVIEGAGGGVDTVWTSLSSYTLGQNVENLFVVSNGASLAVGNQLDNVIGGGAGNDTIIGGAGADTLNGGAGNDTFLFGAGFGNDQIIGFNDGQDRLNISAFNITAANFAGNVNIADAGADTLISFGGADSIRLVGVADATTVTATDFILAT